MQINHNVRAMVTQHSLYQNNNALGKSLEKLSTGLRINRAQDDAAGLAMSEQMRGQIRGLGKAKQNAQDGIAALQIAEGGLAEISNIMQRQRELAVQGANDTLTTTERTYIKNEIDQLADEIDRINKTTDYNSIKMLSDFGNLSSPRTLHIGPSSLGSNVVAISYDATTLAISMKSVTELNHMNFEKTLGSIEGSLKSVNSIRATIGTFINRMEYTVNNIANLEFNTQDAESRIRDTDFAKETTSFTRNQIMVQSATSMLAQANSLPQSVLGLLG